MRVRKLNNKLCYFVFTMIMAVYFLPTGVKTCFALNTEENFYDFVREERRREVVGQTEQEQINSEEEFGVKFKVRLKSMQIAAAFLSIAGVGVLLYTKSKYTLKYKKNIDVDKVNIVDIIDEISPLEVSAIINVNRFTKYDLITVIFDLMRRGILYTVNENESGAKICIREEELSKEGELLENYEDFLIGWLFRKIGDDGCFSFAKLKQYLDLESRAAEFDIDYDIWLDEISEFANAKDITDRSSLKWKRFCAVFGVVFAVIGLILLYVTDSAVSLLLFFVTYFSYRISNVAERRTETAEALYSRLMVFRAYMESAVERDMDFDNTLKWDKYFVYSIPLEKVAIVTEKYNRYEKLYYLMEQEFDKAIRHASYIVSSSIDIT